MGNPDGPTPEHVVEKLVEAVQNPRATAIRVSRGIPGLRRAQAAYYARRFGVELDPESEVIVTLGSKEGLANLAQAITAPGDIVLAPNPCYPIHAFGFIIAGASMRHVPIEPGESISCTSWRRRWRAPCRRRSALVINFPSNPTAEVVDLDFYERGRRFLPRSTTSIVLSDLAYAEIYFDGKPPPSILQVPGAKDIAIEFTVAQQDLFDGRLAHRLRGRQPEADRGADARQILSRLRRLHADPGRGDARRSTARRTASTRSASATSARRDVLVEGFRQAGWDIPSPPASMFAWAPLPPALRASGQPRVLQAAARAGQRRGRRRASASARTARAMCASRWSRTNSGCARRRATSSCS